MAEDLIQKKTNTEQERNPLDEFCGVLNDEDAAVMMSAIDECRRIEPDEC
ncbi:MAG: hypothetical protein VZR24_21900 [Butyrivibrio hungatei]|nr:hypothetical protein [Butyrivibrio hungatei]